MICNFYYAPLKDCTNPYCYYVANREIDCPVKKDYIEKTTQMKMPEARRSMRKE